MLHVLYCIFLEMGATAGSASSTPHQFLYFRRASDRYLLRFRTE